MTGRSADTLRYALRSTLRSTLRGDWTVGFWLAGAGLRGSAFFEISICAGNSL
jgi:hypothetical protein